MPASVERLERRELLCDIGVDGDAFHSMTVAQSFGASTAIVIEPNFPPVDGTWQSAAMMPRALAEVAAGVIGGKVYVVGELDPATFIYDIASNTWSAGAARPFPGNHHAAEVVNGRLYLFGGLTAGSEGKVQIYDPVADAWSTGTDMPFAAGSSSTALIGGMVYVAGGIVGGAGREGTTTDRVAAYDPATDTWYDMAPMPQGRNHTAAGTDGQKLYVFGGRGPGSGDRNVTTNGFDTTQVYDVETNTWQSSLTPGSTLAPLPQARGGMGKAVYHLGAFYVFGGETLTGAGATADGVYHRVDVYHPSTNTWHDDADLPTARHGIFPAESGGKIYVAGGGIHFGGSGSAVMEVLTPFLSLPPAPPPPMPPAPPATVVGRWVFYNNSAYDGNDPAANALDDAAVATDKVAALPGGATSFLNYTSYSKGINGVIVDVANLPVTAGPTAVDFVFETGNGPLTAWAPAPAPSSVTLRRGAGINGHSRITLTWPDGQIQKTWLRVRVAATAATGLAAEDRFYFGNWPGETGTVPGDTRVNKRDAKLVARNRTRRKRPVTAPPLVTSQFDFNRDGVIDVLDKKIVARNKSSRRALLVLIVGE